MAQVPFEPLVPLLRGDGGEAVQAAVGGGQGGGVGARPVHPRSWAPPKAAPTFAQLGAVLLQGSSLGLGQGFGFMPKAMNAPQGVEQHGD